MRCEEIMKDDPDCVSADEIVQNAARLMLDENIGFLPVCDEENRVIGTLTDRDIALRVVAAGEPATTPVEKVMSRGVVACRPSDELLRAEQLMADNQKSRIVLTSDDGELVGILSLSDIAQREGDAYVARTMRGITTRETSAILH